MTEWSALPRELGLNVTHKGMRIYLHYKWKELIRKCLLVEKKALRYGWNNYILGQIIIKNLLRNLTGQFLGAFAKSLKATISFVMSVRPCVRLELSRLIFEKSSNIIFHKNPSSGSRVVLCGTTDRRKWRSWMSIFIILRKSLKEIY